MEVDINNDGTSQCFNFTDVVIGNLKFACDVTGSTVVLWSKYQVFVYENQNFRNYSNKFEPQFEIEDVVVHKNCLLCLDCTGNVNISNSVEPFFIWKQNIKFLCTCKITDTLYVISLQYEQNTAVLLLSEFINDLFNEDVGLQFKMPNEDWMIPKESCIMVCEHVKTEYSTRIKTVFNVGQPDSNYLLIIISLDKRNVYAVLFPIKSDPSNIQVKPLNHWIKLYKSHTDIIDIKITMTEDIFIIIGLAGGNIIKVPLLTKNLTPEVYHLNSNISKFSMIGNTIIYSDVLTLWKNEGVFSKSDSIFKQFAVSNVRDFCVIKDKVICITFANLIYVFNIGHCSSYVKPAEDDCCEVELVTNSDYLQKIIESVKKNDELRKKIKKESEYLMAFSLSKRQDVMDTIIQVTADVFNDYRDIASNIDLTLTDELDAYHDPKSYYFLITISITKVQHKLNKLLSDVLGDIKIHITLFTHGVLKTTSIQVKEQLETTNFVVPLKIKDRNIRHMQIHVKIITNISGKYDEKQRQWTTLYQKSIYLNAENFITMKTNTNATFLKDELPLDMVVYKRAKHLYNNMYKFHIINDERCDWAFFVKLPDNCNLQIKDIIGLINSTDSKKAYVSFKHLMKNSKVKNVLEFQIGRERVRLNIESGNLKVTCPDIIIASEIRNFFSSVILKAFKGELFVDHEHYSAIENLKRQINSCINERISTEEFIILATRFFRKVYCLIPI